jgi:predicted dehydrogenase
MGWRAERPAVRSEPDLQALLADPQVDAVYIATPHASHGGPGAPVLAGRQARALRKAAGAQLAQARELVALSQTRQVFLMEALWTRLLAGLRWCAPLAGQRGHRPGALHPVELLLCGALRPAQPLFDPALAGGALLDIGIYNLALTRWVLEPTAPVPVPRAGRCAGQTACSRLAGVDQRVAATLSFPGGVVSQFVCAFDTTADNTLRIMGEQGSITVPGGFWGASEAVLRWPARRAQTLHAPLRINGFEEEIEEAMRCVRAGAIESPRIPHAETLALMRWIDRAAEASGRTLSMGLSAAW